jgi:hypothetical protein
LDSSAACSSRQTLAAASKKTPGGKYQVTLNVAIVVDQQPTRAGIDPYNKLIDRISDDNMIDITEI